MFIEIIISIGLRNKGIKHFLRHAQCTFINRSWFVVIFSNLNHFIAFMRDVDFTSLKVHIGSDNCAILTRNDVAYIYENIRVYCKIFEFCAVSTFSKCCCSIFRVVLFSISRINCSDLFTSRFNKSKRARKNSN